MQIAPPSWHTGLMQYGRILRVTPWTGGNYLTYLVAEEDTKAAIAIVRKSVGPKAKIEPIGRASLKLLLAMGLSAGEAKRADA